MRPIVVTVGPNAPGATASSLVRFDEWAPRDISVQAVVTGTVNYTIQYSNDDPNSPTNPVAVASMTWSASSLATGATATFGPTPFDAFPLFARVLLNSGTGSVAVTFVQSGSVVR